MMMNRRDSLKYLSVGCSIPFVNPAMAFSWTDALKAVQDYIYLDVQSPYSTALLPDFRVPFQWDYFSIGKGENAALLNLQGKIDKSCKELRLRLTTALDSREEKVVEVSVPGQNMVLGILDCKYAPVLQTTELIIDKKYFSLIQENGLALKLIKGEQPVYFFSGSNAVKNGNGVLFPHILQVHKKTGNKASAFLDQFLSLGSLQPFDWMEGCVLDGFWQMHIQQNESKALDSIKAHLDLFLDDQDNLIQEDPKSKIADNRITDIESTLPFAIIAHLYPEHPVLKKVEKFWDEHLNDMGAVVDHSITAEGAYTIAYPMAVLAKAWNRDDLANMALQQLRVRKKLVFEGNNYLRYYPDTQKRTYKNWARALAWYMLGIVRTMAVLKETEKIDDLVEELNRVTSFVMQHQKEDGLWNCFLDNPETIRDTSGSAGISAAIAAGIHEGFLPEDLKKNVKNSWQGLLSFLTPDGLLAGVAQSNRAGEELQRSDYRVISQMGMGLMGQLYAYL